MTIALGNLYYYPLKLYVFIASYLYFKKLKVVGHKNVPSKGPVIFAINHQNALLDALLLSVVSKRNPYFLTRSDVFKHRIISLFLRGLKMLPIYRIRDGYETIKKNEMIFKATDEILLKKKTVGIFPEGNHNLKYAIRPLQKGVARIAFRAESKAHFKLGLKIIPIGIQYESHFYPLGRTLITFGKPIEVSSFKDQYQQHPNEGIEALLEHLKREMKPLALHVEDLANYDTIIKKFNQRRIYKRKLEEQLTCDQDLIYAIELNLDILQTSDKIPFFVKVLSQIKNAIWEIVGFIPKMIVNFFVHKTTKDPHFYGTMRFVFSIFGYPLIYIFLYLIIRFLTG